jgi:hypothetical protein
MSKPDPHKMRYYIIKVQGVLDECWLDWFNGMQLSFEEQADGTCLSVLSGELKDQSSLHGKLVKLRDLNLPLIELRSSTPRDSKDS